MRSPTPSLARWLFADHSRGCRFASQMSSTSRPQTPLPHSSLHLSCRPCLPHTHPSSTCPTRRRSCSLRQAHTRASISRQHPKSRRSVSPRRRAHGVPLRERDSSGLFLGSVRARRKLEKGWRWREVFSSRGQSLTRVRSGPIEGPFAFAIDLVPGPNKLPRSLSTHDFRLPCTALASA